MSARRTRLSTSAREACSTASRRCSSRLARKPATPRITPRRLNSARVIDNARRLDAGRYFYAFAGADGLSRPAMGPAEPIIVELSLNGAIRGRASTARAGKLYRHERQDPLKIRLGATAGEIRRKHLGQIDEHPRGRTPDVAVLIGQGEEEAGRTPPFAAAALQIGGVDEEVERHLENLGDFERIRPQRIGDANEGDHGDHLEPRPGDISVEPADDLDMARRQADLF